MNYFKCINEVKPSYVIDTEPMFSETVLYENQTSEKENTITLSDDYNNYDIIKFYCYNPSEYYTQYTQYYTTPAMLNHMVTYFEGYCCFNTPGTNQYTLYRVTSNTILTYRAARNMYPIKITGLKCGNGSIVETKIYGKQAIDSNLSPIETQYNLFNDFNMLLGIVGHGWDELCINPQVYICANNKELNVINDNDTQLTEWNVPYYYHNAYVKVSEHSISDNYWIYVAGLKFVPNWDYYIENVSFNSMYNTGLLPWKDAESKNRNWEIGFKMVETGGNMGYYICPSSNPGQAPTLEVTKLGSTSYSLNGQSIGQSLNNKDVKIVCYHGADEANPHLDLFINETKVGTFPINEGTSTQYRTTGALALGGSYIGTKVNGNVVYFGFRWLS